MKKYLFLCFKLGIAICGFSQKIVPIIDKPIIDSQAISDWETLGNAKGISSDGNYFMYVINKLNRNNKLIVQSLKSTWRREFSNVSDGVFSKDGKKFVFQYNDTLNILTLGTDTVKQIYNVASYTYPKEEAVKWLGVKGKNNKLIILNLATGKEIAFEFVQSYLFDSFGSKLLVVTSRNQSIDSNTCVKWVDLLNFESKNIWCASQLHIASVGKLTRLAMDNVGKQVAFLIESKNNDKPYNSIWYFKDEMTNAELKVDNHSNGIPGHLHIAASAIRFSGNGRHIIFQLEALPLSNPSKESVQMDVWNHKDTFLQSFQLNASKMKRPNKYFSTVSVADKTVVPLHSDHEVINSYSSQSDFVVVSSNNKGDRFWQDTKENSWVVNLNDGSRRVLKTVGRSYFWFSPSGNYLIYSDKGQGGNFFSYDLKTSVSLKISSGVTEKLYFDNEYYNELKYSKPVGIAGWLENDKGILVYDNYDIWKLPINRTTGGATVVTNGYGKSHHIKFRVLSTLNKSSFNSIINDDHQLLLIAFNTKTKYNGFYSTGIMNKSNPKLLSMGPFTYYHEIHEMLPNNPQEFDEGMYPLKAENVNLWVVKRHNVTNAPNYFFTYDFKSFNQISDVNSQKKYNWLTAELVTWKQFDGSFSQGILYKPDNFDSTKKYPLVLNYYEQYSHRLFEYPTLEFSHSIINIPWFVSRGYLVFTPDIYFKKGQVGDCAYNAVVSAAKYLSKLKYIDSKHVGINGHSFGGYLTNYLITHSNIFAAAIEGAGTSNYISSALQLTYNEKSSRLSSYEDQLHGISLWNNPNVYFKASPILKANKVTTPLLIFHNRLDDAVPWEQAIELFISLRRLNKKVWMLQYDNGEHGVSNEKDMKDFSIRMTQFFDHYLKELPAPVWMTRGISARMKGLDNGYELDIYGNCGYNCKICKKINTSASKGHKLSLDTKFSIE